MNIRANLRRNGSEYGVGTELEETTLRGGDRSIDRHAFYTPRAHDIGYVQRHNNSQKGLFSSPIDVK
jgi:hypothetical protein